MQAPAKIQEEKEAVSCTVVLFRVKQWEPLCLDNPHIKNLSLDKKMGYFLVGVSSTYLILNLSSVRDSLIQKPFKKYTRLLELINLKLLRYCLKFPMSLHHGTQKKFLLPPLILCTP